MGNQSLAQTKTPNPAGARECQGCSTAGIYTCWCHCCPRAGDTASTNARQHQAAPPGHREREQPHSRSPPLDGIPIGASLPPVGAFPHPAPLSCADFWELLAGLEEQQGHAGRSAAPFRVGSAAEMPLSALKTADD